MPELGPAGAASQYQRPGNERGSYRRHEVGILGGRRGPASDHSGDASDEGGMVEVRGLRVKRVARVEGLGVPEPDARRRDESHGKECDRKARKRE